MVTETSLLSPGAVERYHCDMGSLFKLLTGSSSRVRAIVHDRLSAVRSDVKDIPNAS